MFGPYAAIVVRRHRLPKLLAQFRDQLLRGFFQLDSLFAQIAELSDAGIFHLTRV